MADTRRIQEKTKKFNIRREKCRNLVNVSDIQEQSNANSKVNES